MNATFPLCFCLLTECAFAAATVREGTISLPTYGFSDPNPVPKTEQPMYPYFRFDRTMDKSVERAWKTVVLENDKIRVTLLPEIGGKVWGAVDKASGHEFIYFNHAVKFRDIAMRGPWCSGGIEFNFGILGHSPTTATPADYFIRVNADGSASCFVSNLELVNRTTWTVEVNVPADADFFLTRTTWFNGSNLDGPYYQWMTAAYRARGNPRLFFPGKAYIGHPGDHHPWPVDKDGRDLSVYGNNSFGPSKSYHVLNGDNSMYGIWWPDQSFGSLHKDAGYDKFGRKIWIWALSRNGAIWEDLLTDKDGQYVELQSGRCFNQPAGDTVKTPFKHAVFAPGATDVFEERWGAVHSLQEMQAAATNSPCVERPLEMPKDFDWTNAYGLYLSGSQWMQQKKYEEAEHDLRASLAKEKYFAPALNRLASLLLRRAHYAEARQLAATALSIDTYDPEANYLDGFAALETGDTATARERFSLASYSPLYRSAALAKIAKIDMRAGRWNEAAKAAARSLLSNSLNFDALLEQIVCSRKLGQTGLAAQQAQAALRDYPLFHGARYELTAKNNRAEFLKYIRSEFPEQTLLELGTWYEEAGCKEEAAELFGLAERNPVALVRKAYVLNAKNALQEVAAKDVAFALPFRREALPALRWACRENASWKFRYYLALVMAHLGDIAEADALLDKCDDADSPLFYLYRASHRKGNAALADIKHAALLGDSWRVGHALYGYYSAKEDWQAAREVAETYDKRYPGNNTLQLAFGQALCKTKAWKECLKYLEGIFVLPSEGAEIGHSIYQEAWFGTALDALHAGKPNDAARAVAEAYKYPENLGEGKPYESEIKTANVPAELKPFLPKGIQK